MPKKSPFNGDRQRPAESRPCDLLGLAEVAELLGISVQAVSARRSYQPAWERFPKPRAVFPEPRAELRCGPIWTQRQIDRYKAELADPPPAPPRKPSDRYRWKRNLYALATPKTGKP